MKFLTSSSSSASSTITTTTTATSFSSNVHNSRSITPGGCIAGVFRRLLCLNSLPTHSSDHFKDTDDRDSINVELDNLQYCTNTKAEDIRIESSATPSIVARLMGLESLPHVDFSTTEKSPNSIARSRSMNSVDLMKELVLIQGRHRRVKSFRETRTPTFLELEDEDFFILSFENGDESRVKSKKSEMGSGRTKQSSKGESYKSKNNKRRDSVHEKNRENQDTMNVLNEKLERTINSRKATQRVRSDGKLKDSSNILRPTSNSCQNLLGDKEVVKLVKKSETDLVRRRRRIKSRKDDCLTAKKIETDQSDSENSSPNSVLDIMKFPPDPEVTNSEELSRLANSKSKRTLTEELENYMNVNQSNDKSVISTASCKSSTNEGKRVQLRMNDYGRHNYVEIWGEICKMAERDAIESNWLLRKEIHRFEDYEEIIGEFEIQILDELLGELVHQFGVIVNCIQNF